MRVVLVLAITLAGCGGDSDDPGDSSDGAGSDSDAAAGAADACAGDDGCGGPCAPGNSFGVGRHCTVGGGECTGTEAIFCTVNFNPTDLAFCTRPCGDDTQCGEGATCRSEDGTGPMGCVPNACLSPGELDAGSGSDAGLPDASPADAAAEDAG